MNATFQTMLEERFRFKRMKNVTVNISIAEWL